MKPNIHVIAAAIGVFFAVPTLLMLCLRWCETIAHQEWPSAYAPLAGIGILLGGIGTAAVLTELGVVSKR